MSTTDPQDPITTRDENALGPDEGGLMGENTPFAGGWDRRPSEEGMRIDAAIQSATDTNAGPNSDATTLIDPQTSRDNQA